MKKCIGSEKEVINPDPSRHEPSPETLQMVRDWLWLSPHRETLGLSWPNEHVRDAARMIEAVLEKLPNLAPGTGSGHTATP